jgi:hypothetical protein
MYAPTGMHGMSAVGKNGATYDSTNSRHLQQRLEVADAYEKQ